MIFLGAKALEPLFTGTLLGVEMNITTLSWAVGIVAAAYVAVGGLKACAWADLIQGSALIIGGAVIMVLGGAISLSDRRYRLGAPQAKMPAGAKALEA